MRSLQPRNSRITHMKHLTALGFAMGLVAACAATPATSTALEAGPAATCDAAASGAWPRADGKSFAVTASTSGPNCAQSVVLLVVRDARGDVMWTDALSAARVMGLSGVTTRAAMEQALAEWIGYASQRPQTTEDLPPWPRTAGQLTEAEFPFYPEDWIDEEYYQTIRDQRGPMFCYVQGMESLACLMEFDERLEKVGVQSFPG